MEIKFHIISFWKKELINQHNKLKFFASFIQVTILTPCKEVPQTNSLHKFLKLLHFPLSPPVYLDILFTPMPVVITMASDKLCDICLRGLEAINGRGFTKAPSSIPSMELVSVAVVHCVMLWGQFFPGYLYRKLEKQWLFSSMSSAKLTMYYWVSVLSENYVATSCRLFCHINVTHSSCQPHYEDV